MAIEKMSLVSVEGSSAQLDRALILCCESKCFQIKEPSIKSSSGGTNETNPYSAPYERLRSAAQTLGITPQLRDPSGVEMNTPEEFSGWVDELDSQVQRTRREYDDLKASVDDLLRTETSIQEISRASGFRDYSTFSRAFRTLFHCSPKEWRTEHVPQSAAFSSRSSSF